RLGGGRPPVAERASAAHRRAGTQPSPRRSARRHGGGFISARVYSAAVTSGSQRQWRDGPLGRAAPGPRGLRSMAGIVASAVILASVAAAVPARADTAPPPPTAPSGRADAREMKARGLFARGRYAEALEIYVTLYAETAHPTYIRNIGRCYQNLGEADKAISTFREYLRQAKALTPPQRGEIEGYIREMEELKQKRESRGKEAAPTAARDEPAPAGPEPGASSRPPARKAVPAAAAASPPPSAVEARPARGGGAGGTVAPRKVAALATGA